MGALGLPELCVIGIVAILLFGGKRVAELGRGVGQSIREFKKAHREFDEADKELKKGL